MFSTGQLEMGYRDGIYLERVKKSNGLFGKLFFEHYPGSKGIPGRSLLYLIYRDQNCIGIIGANSPPSNYKIFRTFFLTDNDQGFMNNNVFRLIENEKNLGTQILRLFRKQVFSDHQQKFSKPLQGLVTFVEPPRSGAVYKADNWIYLGMTQGKRMRRGLSWEKEFTDGIPKHIFGYKFKLFDRP